MADVGSCSPGCCSSSCRAPFKRLIKQKELSALLRYMADNEFLHAETTTSQHTRTRTRTRTRTQHTGTHNVKLLLLLLIRRLHATQSEARAKAAARESGESARPVLIGGSTATEFASQVSKRANQCVCVCAAARKKKQIDERERERNLRRARAARMRQRMWRGCSLAAMATH